MRSTMEDQAVSPSQCDEDELREMGLRPFPHETTVPAEAGVPIPGGAISVRLPGGWAPHAQVELDDGSLVFVPVPDRGRTFEPGGGRRVTAVDRAATAVVRRT
jgi:hypothetical protein